MRDEAEACKMQLKVTRMRRPPPTERAAPQALAEPTRIGKAQGALYGATLGTAQDAFLCSYALALWFGSTRVQAGQLTGARSDALAGRPARARSCTIFCTLAQQTGDSMILMPVLT